MSTVASTPARSSRPPSRRANIDRPADPRPSLALIPPAGVRRARDDGAREGKTILVADDDPAVGALLADLLGDEGHTVLRAHDGRRALVWLAAGGCDLPITDNMMLPLPETDLIRGMRGRPELAVPTILMRAVSPPVPPPPPVAFLRKPFDLGRLPTPVTGLLPG